LVQVLIVEDESIIAEDLKVSLRNLGYGVSGVASTGEDAIRCAGELRPGVVLMDIMLKGNVDGIKAAHEILRSLEIPVVYLTAHTDEQTFQRAKITEPYAYIIKPYEERELEIAIETAIYKHQAETKLRKMERWLTTVLQSIGDGVIAIDRDGKITFMNRVAEELTGSTQKEALGKSLFEVFRILDEEGSPLAQNPIAEALEVMPDGPSTHVFLLEKDGAGVPIENSISPIRDEKDQTAGLVIVFRDVTERKRAEVQLRGQLREAEVKYRTLVEQIPAVTYIAADGSVLYVSPQFETFFGYTQGEWVSEPKLWSRQIHPEDRRKVQREREKAFAGEPLSLEYRMLTKAGHVRWLRDEAVPVKDDRGHPSYLQGVMMDITDAKQAEMQLRSSHEQLRALSARLQAAREEERTIIAREIHDELGQVLTALRMDLSLLNRKLVELSPEQLMEEVRSIIGLVDNAINSVRKIATDLRPEVLDHLGLRAAIEWQMQEFQARTGTECIFDSNFETIEVSIDCATAVFRIFQETLTNVARHAGATKVEITLIKDQGNLVLHVKDNGKGITNDDMMNLNSLGILGMRERTLVFGGKIDIIGAPGQGTSVTVRIPLMECHSK